MRQERQHQHYLVGSENAPYPNHILRKTRERRGWTQQELADQLGATPLTVHRWEQGKSKPGSYFRTRLCDLFNLTEQELGLEISPSGVPDRDELSSPSFSTLLWTVPYPRNPFFTGRDEFLFRLHTLLCHERRVLPSMALCGLGGIEKTQGAIEYAYRYAHEYTAIFWLTADTNEALTASLLSSVNPLFNLSPEYKQDQHTLLVALMNWLDNHEDWLLIFDRMEDLELAKLFLPCARQGSLLFTTHFSAPGAHAHQIEIERLTQEESILLFQIYFDKQAPAALNDQTALQQKVEAYLAVRSSTRSGGNIF